MKKKPVLNAYRLCVIGIMAAVFFVLVSYATLRINNIRITFASLPILLLATLFGPVESCSAAVLGEFLHQVLTSGYGLTPTTPLWLLPPVIRALTVSLGCRFIARRTGKPVWKSGTDFILLLVLASILTTLANTGVTWLDSVIFHYYSFAYVFGDFLIRLATGVLTAIVLGIVCIPLCSAVAPVLRQQGFRINDR